MSLDIDPIKIDYALCAAKQYYDQKTYEHALRVMQFVAEDIMIPSEYKNECMALAIMHDLLEDTYYSVEDLNHYFEFQRSLKLLTRDKNKDYIEYIKSISDMKITPWGQCAWHVKMADMKDHLTQKETLTDRLKEKYLNAISYLI